MYTNKNFENIVKEKWGQTSAYKEFKQRGNNPKIDTELLELFKDAGSKSFPENLRHHITKNYYTCTNKILFSLADMYITPEFKYSIDTYAGKGSAEAASKNIKSYLAEHFDQ